MKKFVPYIFGSLLSLLVPIAAFSTEYEWNSSFPEAEDVYIEAFTEAYKGIPREILRIPNLENFLSEEFEEEASLLDETAHTICWITAYEGEKLVGMASFDLTNFPEEVFLRKVFVAPNYQRKGIGKALVFSILTKYPQTKKIFTITRMLNEKSLLFFKSIGFSHCRYLKEGFFSSQHTSLVYDNSAK